MNSKLFFVPALFMVSSIGFAGDQASDVISELDADQDGQISQTEASASASVMQSFAAIDQNQDANLSEEELDAYLSQQGGAPQPAPTQHGEDEEAE